jgi:hypothetical protein
MELEDVRWFGVRLAFVYVALFGLWTLTGLVPPFAPVYTAYLAGWKPLIDVLALGVMGYGDLDPTGGGTGSGDSIYGWMFALANLVVALVGAVVWTAIDRRRGARLVPMTLGWVRWIVGTNMIVYGAVKVFSSQFGDLHPLQLAKPVGEYSPMVLLWTFMGYSDGYEVFTGLVELLAGVLLLVPTTAFLGSVVALGATAHVLVLNLCFDVPVKLLASHLFVGSLALVAHDGRRWFPALVLGRPLAPVAPAPPISDRMRRWSRVAKLVVIATLVVGDGLYFLAEDHTDDPEQAAARAKAAEFPLMRHRMRWIDDRTSMWD